MPKEVVYHRSFHREHGRREIIKVQPAFKKKQHTKLHKNSHRADQVKLAPAHERGGARQIFPAFWRFFAAGEPAKSAQPMGSQ
jgi:hypothetical protein